MTQGISIIHPKPDFHPSEFLMLQELMEGEMGLAHRFINFVPTAQLNGRVDGKLHHRENNIVREPSKMMVWKRIFLSTMVLFGVHVNYSWVRYGVW